MARDNGWTQRRKEQSKLKFKASMAEELAGVLEHVDDLLQSGYWETAKVVTAAVLAKYEAQKG